MQHDRDEEMGEEMEGTGDYLRYSQKYGDHRRGRESYDSRGPRRSLILWIFGIVLFVLVMVLLFGGDDKGVIKELNAIKDRIVQLEKRLPDLDGTGERVARLEDEVSGLKKSISKLNRSVASKTRAPRVIRKKSTSPAKRRFHKVLPGDTLYGIAGKYGLTVDQLRRYNNLDKNQGIQPGQKIWVTPGTR